MQETPCGIPSISVAMNDAKRTLKPIGNRCRIYAEFFGVTRRSLIRTPVILRSERV